MNKQEIAETLRNEVGELEVSIKKLQARCDRMKSLVLNWRRKSPARIRETKLPGPDSKFRKIIDQRLRRKTQAEGLIPRNSLECAGMTALRSDAIPHCGTPLQSGDTSPYSR